jgi:signal transduction histidine kinase
LFDIGRASAFIHSVVVSLTMLVLWGWYPTFVVFWGLLMGLLTLALGALSLSYPTNATDPTQAERYGLLHSLVVTGIGLAWGGGSWIVAGSSDEFLLFYTFVLGGTALGAVSSQHSLLRSCLLSIWTSIPLLALALALLGPSSFGGPLSVLVLFFGITLTVTARRMNRFLSNSVSLTFALNDKVEELTALSKELEQARVIAESAERSKTELLAQASHDLRHPVHAIGLFVESLEGRIQDPESLAIIQNISKSVNSMARLFRSLLDMSALDLGRIHPKMAPVKLGHLLADVVGQAVEAQQNGRLRSIACHQWVNTDPALLHTVIQNLLTNALKYSEGGRILVGCRRRNGALTIEIHDKGPGIALEDQERVFTPFVRLAPLNLGHGEGLGLGLAIVQRMVKLLGLSLRLSSTPGKGTLFAIDGLIPCAAPQFPVSRHKGLQSALLEGLQTSVVALDTGLGDEVMDLIRDWGCQVRCYQQLEEMDDEMDFVVIVGLTAESAATLPWSKLPVTAVVAVTVDPDTPLDLPQTAFQLKLPVKPLQLRSLLLTAAAAKEPTPITGTN